jgi:2-methylcitrate dehydratase PrpD
MEYCVASALIDGELKMSSFTESNISRNDIADLMKKITFEIDAFVENDREFAVIFDLKILSKEKISQRVDVASGKPGNWLTQSALKSKFMECVGNDTLGPDLFSLIQDLRHLNSMVSLASKLYQCLD